MNDRSFERRGYSRGGHGDQNMSIYRPNEPIPVEGRVPPHDLDAEAAVLAAIMLEATALDRVIEILKPEHFYSDANRRIFEAAIALVEDGTPVDIKTIGSWLRSREWINQIGGPAYLVQLVDCTPSVAHVAAHAQIVHEKWRIRQLIGTCQRIAAEGYGVVGDVDNFIDCAEQSVYYLAHQKNTLDTVQPITKILTTVFSNIQAMAENGQKMSGYPSGFDDCDAKTAGIHDGHFRIVAGRPGMGKAQPHDSKVLTPEGWRKMGDLAVGDLVIGSSGHPCRIIGVYEQGELDTFNVNLDDGSTTRCCDEHLWLTRTRADRRKGVPGAVKTLKNIRETMQRSGGGINHSLQFAAPVHFADKGDRPIDPWLLGMFIGDGSFRGSSVRISNPELDIQERVRKSVHSSETIAISKGIEITISKRINGIEKTETGAALVRFGLHKKLSCERFIPHQYLYAPIADRIELLRGIVDADGYVTDSLSSIEYLTTSPQLRDDIVFLVRSLGGRATWQHKKTHYTKMGERFDCRDAYRMQLAFPDGNIIPMSSKKHLAKFRGGPLRLRERFIESVTPAGRAPCRCIMVDAPDRLYVTDDFVVTHNTSFVMNEAVNVASPRIEKLTTPDGDTTELCSFGLGVLVCSLEMPREDLVVRMLCGEARVDLNKVRKGNLQLDDWNRLTEAAKFLASLPIWIDDTPSMTLLDIRAKLRRIQAEWDRKAGDGQQARRVGVVYIDYIQLMKGRQNAGNREQEIAEISRGLKELAKECRVNVTALSQLNRAVETRNKGGKGGRPMMSDLRESGSLEQDSDAIMFLYRDEYYNPTSSKFKGIAELNIAKQRQGSTGRIYLRFNAQYTRFDNLAPGEQIFDDEADQ